MKKNRVKNLLFKLLVVGFFMQTILPENTFNTDIEVLIRMHVEDVLQECKNCEKLLGKLFPATAMAEIVATKFAMIPTGNLYDKSLYKEAWDIADEIIMELEQFADYKDALDEAKNKNDVDAWNKLVHEIAYFYTRKITENKSDLVFPSLYVHNEQTNAEKIKNFCLANSSIDVEKNTPFLAATLLVLYYFKQMQKAYL